jgi:predicted ATPase
MKFTALKGRASSVSSATSECFLFRNNWDDFGFKTTFEVVLFDSFGNRYDLGHVQIIEFGMSEGHVEIPDNFQELDEGYCSLGNSRGYYIKLIGVPKNERILYLRGIRDCAFDHSIWDKFKSQQSMKASILRSSTQNDVLTIYPRILDGHTEQIPYDFNFEFKTGESGEKQRCEFSVRQDSNPPSNIHVLIDRNGVGKTRLLAGMADALTQSKVEPFGWIGQFDFLDNGLGPSEFLNLVVVSYSAFDRFDPIQGKARTELYLPYYYVGIKKHFSAEDEVKADGEIAGRSIIKYLDDLNKEFEESICSIAFDSSRIERWISAMNILSSDPGIEEIDPKSLLVPDVERAAHEIAIAFSRMSSGHKIVLLTITKLVEFVSDQSLVLIDEPETHLHPPLLGSFVRALSKLLVVTNGVAVVATHSPVVLQEVPANCVSLLTRSGNDLRVMRPDIETFAENVSVLTRPCGRIGSS